MTIELNATSENAVQTLLGNGWYTSAEQVLEIALLQLLLSEPNSVRLRKLVQQGIDSAKNEPLITGEQLLQSLAERRLKRT